MVKVGKFYEDLAEGDYTFYIEDVDYKEDFGSLKFRLKTNTGKTRIEFCDLKKKDSTGAWTNENHVVNLNKFSDIARACFNDPDFSEDIEPIDLKGRYFNAPIIHKEWNGRVFVNIDTRNATYASGFPTSTDTPAEKTTPAISEEDIDDLLSEN